MTISSPVLLTALFAHFVAEGYYSSDLVVPVQYVSADAGDNISNAQSRLLLEVFGIEDPDDVCIRGAEIPERIEVSNAITDPDDVFIMDSIDILRTFSPLSEVLYDSVIDPDNFILVCALEDHLAYGAFFPGQRLININPTYSFNYGVPFPSEDEIGNLLTYRETLRVAYEEALHAHISIERPGTHAVAEQQYSAEDDLTFMLAEEAFVRVNMAVDAVLSVYELGDDGLFEYMRLQNSADSDMVRYLLDQVRSSGPDVLEDPDVLFNTFEMFFRDADVLETYYHAYQNLGYFADFLRDRGTQPIPIQDLEQAYGTLMAPLESSNFLQGRYQSLQDIVSIMPENSNMRRLLSDNSSPSIDGPQP